MVMRDVVSMHDDNMLKGTRRPVKDASHLPGKIYTSAEIFTREKEEIFLRQWLCLTREEELEKPGDYVTFRIMGEPVIIVRNDAGKINAFSNICRHRGVEVASGSGNLEEFSCPYHGWTYSLDGELVGAPYMKEAETFNLTSCHLKMLKSATWGGYIFINFADDGEPFSDFISEIDQEFGFLRQEELRIGDKIVTNLQCNWKLVVENLIDFYHAKTLHAETFGSFVDLDMNTIRFNPLSNGGFSMFYNSGAMLPGGKPPMGNIPWLAEKPHTFATMGLLPPMMVLFGHCDNTQAFLAWPLTESTTRIEIQTLFAKEQLNRPDFREHVNKYHDFMSQVVDEDREMVNSLQRNLVSRRFKPGRMSVLEENIHMTINNYLDRVFSPTHMPPK